MSDLKQLTNLMWAYNDEITHKATKTFNVESDADCYHAHVAKMRKKIPKAFRRLMKLHIRKYVKGQER